MEAVLRILILLSIRQYSIRINKSESMAICKQKYQDILPFKYIKIEMGAYLTIN